jgi:hypothetical protein
MMVAFNVLADAVMMPQLSIMIMTQLDRLSDAWTIAS